MTSNAESPVRLCKRYIVLNYEGLLTQMCHFVWSRLLLVLLSILSLLL